MTAAATRRTWWLALALAPVVVGTVLSLVGFLVFDLPDPMASHFAGDGTPDGAAGVTTMAVVFAGTGLLTIVAVVAVWARWTDQLPLHAAWLGWLGLLMGGVGLQVTAGNDGAADWTAADPLHGGLFVAILLVPAAIGVAVGVVLHRDIDPPPVPPAAALAPHAESVPPTWTGRVRNAWLQVSAAVAAAIGVWLWVVASAWVGAVVLLTGALLWGLSGWTVTTSPGHLDVRFPVPFVRLRFGPDEVVDASAVEVRPADWGGWGYRGSLRLLGRAALVHRAGEGLQVTLTDNRVLAITIDDAPLAAAVLTSTPT